MTFSPWTSRTLPYDDGKFSSRFGTKVVRVNVHHWAGTAGGEERMVDPDEDVSCNYLILSTGEVVGQIPEQYRAHTSGSAAADNPAITIEVQNSSRHVENGDDSNPKSWPISSLAYQSLVGLIADIAYRHGWGDVGSTRVRGHREFSATACPGGYIWNRLGDIRAAAHKVLMAALGGTTPAPQPAPAPSPAPAPAASSSWSFNKPNFATQLRIQKALKNRGRYSGPLDGVWGPNTIKGIQTTIRNVGYSGSIDGVPGPSTCYYVQDYAAKFGDYSGPIDKVLGPNSWAGFALGLERP